MISNLIVLTCATQAAPRIGGAAWSSAAVPAACSRAGLQQLPLAPRPSRCVQEGLQGSAKYPLLWLHTCYRHVACQAHERSWIPLSSASDILRQCWECSPRLQALPAMNPATCIQESSDAVCRRIE